MNNIPILTDINVVEGIVASILFPILIFITRQYRFGIILSSAVSWFITWVFRKASVNIMKEHKRIHNIGVKYYSIPIPKWLL